MKIQRLLHIVLAVALSAACGSSSDFVDDDGSAPDAPSDGLVDVAEEASPDAADDPADDPTDDPAPDGPAEECGNGSVDGGEDCDDGNDVDGDGCDTDCTWSCERNWECADEDFCTSDVCDVGTHTCTHETIDCADVDDCTVDGCDPSTGCTHERLPTWYRDEDGDGFGVATDTRCAATEPEGYADTDGDCCDTNEDANPDQTGWFATAHECGSYYTAYDYDCNGTNERRWTALGHCSHSGGGCSVAPGWAGTYAPYCGYVGTWIETCVMDTGGTMTCVPGETVTRTQECH
jgi:cysteine-rich repeat protein